MIMEVFATTLDKLGLISNPLMALIIPFLWNQYFKLEKLDRTVSAYMTFVGSEEYEEKQKRLDRLFHYMSKRSEEIFFKLQTHLFENKKKGCYDFDKILQEAFEMFRKFNNETQRLLLEEGYSFEEIEKFNKAAEFLVPQTIQKYKDILEFFCETKELNGKTEKIIKDNFKYFMEWSNYNWNLIIKKIR